jgi:hypothetical protein
MSHALLAEAFSHVSDPRDPRGVRHSIRSLLALVFLGMLARIREMAVLQRWAETHWAELREAIGSDRMEGPHATTISRALAQCSLAEFAQAFARWLREDVLPDGPLEAAVDAKTACQGFNAEGRPVQILTVFVHRLKLVLGQWSVTGEKSNEPAVLKNHLDALLQEFPLLQLLTGDALYAQRPLVASLADTSCDYLFQVKDNQPEVREALQNCLGQAHERPPAAETAEKRGATPIGAASGWIWTMPTISANAWGFPTATSPCASIAT